jgi:hypothetical protein
MTKIVAAFAHQPADRTDQFVSEAILLRPVNASTFGKASVGKARAGKAWQRQKLDTL